MYAQHIKSSKLDYLIAITLGLAYTVGCLSVHHFLPSMVDFLPNLEAALVCSFGLSVVFLLQKNRQLGLDSIFWLLLFLLILIQPFINKIPYPDTFVFPLGMILGCYLISNTINNTSYKDKFIKIFSGFAIFVAAFTTIAQLCQYYGLTSSWIMFYNRDEIRFYGNVGQPNQTALILAIGMASVIYYLCLYPNITKISGWLLRCLACALLGLFGIGVALTASRGGVFLGLVALGLPFFIGGLTEQLGDKVKCLLACGLVSVLGYAIGSQLLANYSYGSTTNALVRMTDKTIHYRTDLLYQAWLAFTSRPITGVGFNNFAFDALNHIDQLTWLPFALHSHNLVAQIAAELGIIGLILILIPSYIYLKSLWMCKTLAEAQSCVILTIILMYSFTEFPLWFFRYELVFASMLAVVNKKIIVPQIDFSKLYSLLALVIFVSGVFYYASYQDAIRVANVIARGVVNNPTSDEYNIMVEVKKLPNTFGFSDYKERFIFQALPTDDSKVKEKISLGNRVLSTYMTDYTLSKQAVYYGLDNQPQKSVKLFKSACFLNEYVACYSVVDYLTQVQQKNILFKPIYQDFNKWYLNNADAKKAVETRQAQQLYTK